VDEKLVNCARHQVPGSLLPLAVGLESLGRAVILSLGPAAGPRWMTV
jgi:hypothetical protein